MYMHGGFSIDLVNIYLLNCYDYTTVEIAAGAHALMGGRTYGVYGTLRSSISWDLQMVSALLEMNEWDADVDDCVGVAALAWAASREKEEVVCMILVQENVNPNRADRKYSRRPLSREAEKGMREL